MGNKITIEGFKERASKVHNFYYNYKDTVYLGSKNKITISCPLHGNFEQKAENHLAGRGCKKCGAKKIKGLPPETKEIFIDKARKTHKDIYDYSKVEYKNSQTKVIIICKTHGDFEQQPNNHIQGQGCTRCGDKRVSEGKKSNTDTFLKKASKIHGNVYLYNKVNYKGNRDSITITCPTHGDFEQLPVVHLRGSGCTLCGQTSHWKRSDYINKAKGKKVTFYIIRCFSKEESFYKIGITFQKITYRYNNNKRMPYMYEVISEVHGNAEDIWDLELFEKRRLKKHNYQPLIKFPGSKTECFTKI